GRAAPGSLCGAVRCSCLSLSGRVRHRLERDKKRARKIYKLRQLQILGVLAAMKSEDSTAAADFHNKTALWIVREFDAMAVEDLNVKGMVKNHHLVKSVSDAGWNQFVLILRSKAEEAGRVGIKVNPSYTSQDCSRCGQRERKTLATREHRCDNCGPAVSRDHNAAINIKGRAGLSGMVPAGESREPRISTYSR